MNLSSEYRRQFGWRAWPKILDALPPVRGQVVLDLGCAVGDQAAELVARGAQVIGVDIDDELIEEARSRRLPGADFRQADLRTLPTLGVMADGLWSSFSVAYFPDLPTTLTAWSGNVRSGGWIALTEIDDLFGHEPLSTRAKGLLDAYALDALTGKRYDFHMGRKLKDHLERSGFGDDFENVREEFLHCLTGADHRSLAKVYCCIARKCGTDKASVSQNA